jgi:UDP-glucose 4-epimerase
MKCCVIGGAGFLGSHLTPLLVQSGRTVTVLGRRPATGCVLPAGVNYVACDYGNRDRLKDFLRDTEEVIHLAYSTVPKTSFEDPIYDLVSNLPASVGLLQEAAAAGVRKVVLVSSGGTVYGVAKSLPIDEDHATSPISPYGITKLTIEKYAGMFGTLSGLPVVIARPGNAYGEGQRAFAEQGFVATAMYSVLQGKAIEIFGSPGTIRDYIHVSDVARGILAALEHGQSGHAYNIGTGKGRNNIDVLRMIGPLAQHAGFSLRIKESPSRTFDVPANVLDSSKLAAISGWRPEVTFEEGIRRIWDATVAGA